MTETMAVASPEPILNNSIQPNSMVVTTSLTSNDSGKPTHKIEPHPPQPERVSPFRVSNTWNGRSSSSPVATHPAVEYEGRKSVPVQVFHENGVPAPLLVEGGSTRSDVRTPSSGMRIPSPTVYHIPLGALPNMEGDSSAYDVVVEIHTSIQSSSSERVSGSPVTATAGMASRTSISANPLLSSWASGHTVRRQWFEHPGLDTKDGTAVRTRMEECIAIARATAARGEFVEALELLVELQRSFETGATDSFIPLVTRAAFVQLVGQNIQDVTCEWTASIKNEGVSHTRGVSELSNSTPSIGYRPTTSASPGMTQTVTDGKNTEDITMPGNLSFSALNAAGSMTSQPATVSSSAGKVSPEYRRSVLGGSGRRDTFNASGAPRRGIPIPRDPLVMQPVSMNSSMIGELSSDDDDHILGDDRNEPFLMQGNGEYVSKKEKRVKYPMKHDDDDDSHTSPGTEDLFKWVAREEPDVDIHDEEEAIDEATEKKNNRTAPYVEEEDSTDVKAVPNEPTEEKEKEKEEKDVLETKAGEETQKENDAVELPLQENANHKEEEEVDVDKKMIAQEEENHLLPSSQEGTEGGDGLSTLPIPEKQEEPLQEPPVEEEPPQEQPVEEEQPEEHQIEKEELQELQGGEASRRELEAEVKQPQEQPVEEEPPQEPPVEEEPPQEPPVEEEPPQEQPVKEEQPEEHQIEKEELQELQGGEASRRELEAEVKQPQEQPVEEEPPQEPPVEEEPPQEQLVKEEQPEEHQIEKEEPQELQGGEASRLELEAEVKQPQEQPVKEDLISISPRRTSRMETEKQSQNDEHRSGELREREEALPVVTRRATEELPPITRSRASSQGHEVQFSGSTSSQLPPRPPSSRLLNSPRISCNSRGVSPVPNIYTPLLPSTVLPPPYSLVDDMSAKEVLLHNGPARPRVSKEFVRRPSGTLVSSTTSGPDMGEEKHAEKHDHALPTAQSGVQEMGHTQRPAKAESSVKSVHVVREEEEILMEGMTSRWSCGDEERPVEEDFLAGSTNIDTKKGIPLWNEGEEPAEALEEQHSQERRSTTGSYHKRSASQDDRVQDSMEPTEGNAREVASSHEVHSLPRVDTNETENKLQVHDEGESERGGSVTSTETALEQLHRCSVQQRDYCAYPFGGTRSAGPYSASFRNISAGCTVYAGRKAPLIESEEVAFKRNCDLFRNRSWQHSNGDSLLPPKEWLRARRGNRKMPDEKARPIPQSAKRPASAVEEKVLAEIFQEKKPCTYLLVPTKPKKCVSEPNSSSETRNGIYQRAANKRSASGMVEQHLNVSCSGAKGSLPPSANSSCSHASSLSGKHVSLETLMSPVKSAVYGKSLDDPVLVLRVVDHSNAAARPS